MLKQYVMQVRTGLAGTQASWNICRRKKGRHLEGKYESGTQYLHSTHIIKVLNTIQVMVFDRELMQEYEDGFHSLMDEPSQVRGSCYVLLRRRLWRWYCKYAGSMWLWHHFIRRWWLFSRENIWAADRRRARYRCLRYRVEYRAVILCVPPHSTSDSLLNWN